MMTAYDAPELVLRSPQAGPETVAIPGQAADGSLGTATATPQPGLGIELRGVCKRYGAREVLRDIDLHIAPGEFVAIIGKSGCGKSTLLRLLAGLEAADAGALAIDGRPPGATREDTRLMFQDARLLPWKRVAANVELGLTSANAPSRARGALAQVGLGDRAHEWPAVLSGGQKQRVALARALAIEPRMLLLDEPFGALDAKVRKELRQGLRDIHDSTGLTTVFVTHDQDEAMELADLVVVMSMGRIEQIGKPQDIRARPATPFVRDFIAA